jgi:hypothetical protein
MKLAFRAAAVIALACLLGVATQAEEKKKVTLKGIITCGKCDLGETPACSNVIKVKEDGKEVIYYFNDKGREEKYHCCKAPKAGSVTGVVEEKDKKKWITPDKDGVKFD